MKRENSFKTSELMCACALMFLSPALRLIPERTSRLCGKSAWISVLWALPVLLLYVLFLRRFTSSADGGEALGSVILRCLGDTVGRVVLLIFAVWFLIYCGFTMRIGANRMITTVYTNASPALFISVAAALSLTSALGSESRIMRFARLAVPTVAAILVLVLICASDELKAKNLLPLSGAEVLYSARGSVTAVDVAVLPMYLSLFLSASRGSRTDGMELFVIAVTALAFWMNISVTGSFGAELTARLTQPFFVLVRNIVVFRTVERLEAVVVSLWVFSDFILTSVCLCVSSSTVRLCMGKRCTYEGEKALDVNNSRWVIWLCALAAAVFALVFAPTQDILTLWSEKIIPYTNLILAFVLLPAVYLVGKFRKTV